MTFALFDDRARADAALRTIRDEDLASMDDIGVLVHEEGYDVAEAESLSESDARSGLFRGAVLGALAGIACGVIVGGPAGLVAAGTLADAVLGAGAGTLIGALSGGLFGAGLPDPRLEDLADELKAGKVLVTHRDRSQDDRRPDRADRARARRARPAQGPARMSTAAGAGHPPRRSRRAPGACRPGAPAPFGRLSARSPLRGWPRRRR